MIRRVKVPERSNYSAKTNLVLEGMKATVKAGDYVFGRKCVVGEDTVRTLQSKDDARQIRIVLSLAKNAEPDAQGNILHAKVIIDDMADQARPEEVDRARFNVWELGRFTVEGGAQGLEDCDGILYVTG